MSSVQLRGITARNFLSYGNADQYVDLSYIGTTLVLGDNKDQGGHNGVGKTTILEAISYALYGKTLAKIKKTKIKNNINTNKNDSMEVNLELEVDNHIYEIVRGIGTDVDLAIYKDKDYSNPITPDSIANTNKFIEDLIGLSYELFRITVVFLGSDNSFFEMGQGKQRDILSELFKILTLNDKAEILKEVIKTTNEDLKVTEAVIKQQEDAKNKRDSQVKAAENRVTDWEVQKELDIVTLSKRIEKVDDINVKEQEELFENIKHFESGVVELNTEHNKLIAKILEEKESIRNKFQPNIDKLNIEKEQKENEINPKIKELKNKLDLSSKDRLEYSNEMKQKRTENTQAEKDIASTIVAIEKLEKEIIHLQENKCPYCKQKYNDVIGKIEESENEVISLKEYKDSCNKIISNNVAQIDKLSDLSNKSEEDEKKLIPVIQDLELELKEVLLNIDIKVKTIKEEMDKEIISKDSKITELETAKNISQKEFEDNIQYFKDQCIYSNMTELLNRQKELQNWKNELSLKEESQNPHLEPLEALLIEDEVNVDYETLDNLKDDIEHMKFLLKLLTDKKSFIRRRIINKNIPFLNSRLREYTKELGLPHVIKFGSDMDCEITSLGKELDYGNLSGGEGKRVDLALSLAFRDILEHLHTGINVLLLDEIDAGRVDPLGIDDTIRLLKHKSREEELGIWVIAHNPAYSSRFNRELTITKQDGFSSLGEFE